MINFFRFGEHNLPLPERATVGAAGYDLRTTEDFHLISGEFRLVKTGFGVELEPGLVGLIRDRSGLASKRITTRAGVIDCDYRGEIRIILVNEGNDIWQVARGERVAQLLILPCIMELSGEIALPSATDRGTKGFGSTGQ